MLLLFVLFCFVFFVYINTVIHEFGHAIPLVLLTKQKAEVYLGSHGDKADSRKMNVGLFDIYLKKDIAKWRWGLCKPLATKLPIKQQIIYIAAGPVVAFLCAMLISYIGFAIDKDGDIKPFNNYFLWGSIFIFLVNILPTGRRITLANGNFVNNDGTTLLRLLRLRRYEQEYVNAIDFYTKGNFADAAPLFAALCGKVKNMNVLYHYTYVSYLQAKQYGACLAFYNDTQKQYKPDALGFFYIGTLKIFNKIYAEALPDLERAVNLQPNNVNTLNNIGHCCNMLHKFGEAIQYLDRAIQIKPDFAMALSNRGYAKMKCGQLYDGYIDTDNALKLDPANADAHRNMGLYFMNSKSYDKAMPYLQKAKELDATTDIIDELIAEASLKMNNVKP